MSNLFKYLLKKKLTIIIMIIVSLLLGFFISRIVTYMNAYYTARFEIINDVTFDYEQLTSKEYLQKIKKNGYNETTKTNKYENINITKMLKKHDFTITKLSDNTYEIKTAYKYYDIFFISSSKSLGTRSKMFIKDSVTNLVGKENIVFSDPINIVKINQKTNDYIYSLYFLLIGFVITISVLTIQFYKKEEKEIEFKFDNQTTFKSIFNKNYLKASFKAISKTKDLAIMGLLFGMMIICKFIPLPSGFGDLGISFTYIFFAIISLIYGPAYGFLIGILSDTIGFIIRPSGFFFIGYTLQAALSGMIYGLCLYKTKVNYGKVLLSRILINMLMNVLFGSILYAIVFTDFKFFSREFTDFVKSYAILFSLPKNLFYLLPQSLLLYFVIKKVSPVLNHFELISDEVYNHIKILE